MPALSEGKKINQELNNILEKDEFKVEDVLIDRNTQQERDYTGTAYFSLAIMFGAVGVAALSGAETTTSTTASVNVINTGSSLAGTAKLGGEPTSMKYQVEEMETMDEKFTPIQLLQMAFQLILQAFMTAPAFAYISFALSLVFILLWLNPFSKNNKAQLKVRKSTSRRNRNKSHSQVRPVSHS